MNFLVHFTRFNAVFANLKLVTFSQVALTNGNAPGNSMSGKRKSHRLFTFTKPLIDQLLQAINGLLLIFSVGADEQGGALGGSKCEHPHD